MCRHLWKLADAVEDLQFAAGHKIICEGDMAEAMYIIKEGQCVVSQELETHARLCTSTILTGGSYFGERALITQEPRHRDTVEAACDVSVLRIDREAFIKLLGPLHEKLDMAMPNDGSPASNLRRFPEDLRVSPDAGGNANGLMSRGDSSRSGSHQRLEELPTGQLSPQYLLSPDASQHGGSLFSRGEASLHGGSMWVVGGTGGGSRENSQRGGSLFGGLGGVSPLVRAPPPPLDQLTFVTGLGAGGFGRVQLMRDTKTRRVYALKVINKYTVLHLLKSASLGSGRPPARLLCLLAPRCAPDGLGRLGTFRARPSHWAPRHRLGGSSEPLPKDVC